MIVAAGLLCHGSNARGLTLDGMQLVLVAFCSGTAKEMLKPRLDAVPGKTNLGGHHHRNQADTQSALFCLVPSGRPLFPAQNRPGAEL